MGISMVPGRLDVEDADVALAEGDGDDLATVAKERVFGFELSDDEETRSILMGITYSFPLPVDSDWRLLLSALAASQRLWS